jgi:Cft2 family RNA processing exonuclease
VLGSYSAHGDRHELQAWLDAVRAGNTDGKVPEIHLVHGEVDAQDAFAAQLRAAGYDRVSTPTPHTKVEIT